ncbi:MAG: flagellar assembly protein FliH [Gammaproteobacteria bacterium]|jgi:flagellar assembly protein FliH
MSRIIPLESAPDCERWQAPNVAGTGEGEADAAGGGHLLTREDLEALEARIREENRELGRQEGLAAGADEVSARVTRFDAALTALARPFDELDRELEDQLLALVRSLTRHLVRRELRMDPSQVIGIIREAIRTLPAAAREIHVHLHPEDAEVVRECLGAEIAERAWHLEEDPVMERGGCRVVGGNSEVDARLELRLGRLINDMLGSERATDE